MNPVDSERVILAMKRITEELVRLNETLERMAPPKVNDRPLTTREKIVQPVQRHEGPYGMGSQDR